MDGRKRTVQIKFRVTEEERALIEQKMKLVPTRNMEAYLRKMAIDGYVVNLDMPELRELTSKMKRISNSENQIAKQLNTTGNIYETDIEEIKKNNLFQYPTERLVARMVRSCYKRLDALDDEQLRQELSSAPAEIAKQINLYAMMRYNRIVWDFMVGVVGEKFRSQDFEFSRKDLNVFFSHLQEQNDDIAGWSESTVNKIKQVLTKILVEVEILDTFKSTRLNPLFLCEELEEGIRRNNDLEALAAFNCFR